MQVNIPFSTCLFTGRVAPNLFRMIAGITPFPTGKYSSIGPFTMETAMAVGIPPRFAETYAKAMNASKSRKSWAQRKTVLNKVFKCQSETHQSLPFPWLGNELAHFVGWLMEEGLRSSTIEQYVSNIRSIHSEMDLRMNELQWKFISKALKGHNNLSEPSPSRVPITPDLMFHLKRKLSTSRFSEPERRLIWVVSTAMFQGSFRINEILSPTTTRFCPESSLLTKDVKWESTYVNSQTVRLLKFNIKKPKETRGGQNVPVEIFELKGCFYSCTEAWMKWRRSSSLPLEEGLPPFRWENGKLLTPNQFNLILKEFLNDRIQYIDGFIATHSFRGGLVSVMALLGYSEQEIQRQGRWCSDSYKDYLKLGRSARVQDQWTLATRISELIGVGGNLSRL